MTRYVVVYGDYELASFFCFEEAERYLEAYKEDLLDNDPPEDITPLDIVEYEVPKPRYSGSRWDETREEI